MPVTRRADASGAIRASRAALGLAVLTLAAPWGIADAAPSQSGDQSAPAAQAQPGWLSGTFTGFVDVKLFAYPRELTEFDDRTDAWLTLFVRQELRLGSIRLVGSARAEKTTGSEQTSLTFDPADRGARRPPVSVRDAWVALPLAPAIDLQVGRFDPGWGRTDGYSPGDAFLPRDLSDPFANERLPLWGARVQGERGRVRFEAYHSFVTTPWRLPVMLGRLSPVWYADLFLVDADEEPPSRGFDVGRLLLRGNQWDVGVWGRTGVRPAPVVEPLRERQEERPSGTFVPLSRRFGRETAYGVEVVRVEGPWLLRGELAHSRADDPDVGEALLWAVGVERMARNGPVMVTLAGNAKETPVDPLLLFDRAFLPFFVATSTQLEPWGSWKVTWLGTFRRVGGILAVEVSRDLSDVAKVILGADLPHGSRTSSPGAVSRARRASAGLRWSW